MDRVSWAFKLYETFVWAIQSEAKWAEVDSDGE